ncbi:MAG: LytTR family DNA-binding domain-containing protein, partial [Gammaproteobacteria bacterium]|nr:LytTR family DNA-binding domain-containing protein [Gammaproteobacteria bacterium]
FLDIQMPGFDGFEVVRNLQVDDMPLVIFVTAFDQFAIKAFEIHAVDYILKPADTEHLSRALAHAKESIRDKKANTDKQKLINAISEITGKKPSIMEEWLDSEDGIPKHYPEKITIKDDRKITLLPIREIDWVDAAGDYMCIHATGKIHIVRTTMKQLENQLDPVIFQRIHRSTIVNLNRVKEIISHINGEYNLVLNGDVELKMSRSYKDKLQHFL